MGEFEYIDWVRSQAAPEAPVEIGPGDDCAALRFRPGHATLVTCDVLMDGRHFVLGEAEPGLIGRKAMAVNLSDIAAMAGSPVAAVVGVALPRSWDTNPRKPVPTQGGMPVKNDPPKPPLSKGGLGGSFSHGSVAAPRTTRSLAEALYHGIRELADEFACPLVGGDTNTWDGPLVISVTLLGEAHDKGPVRRSGARVGDWLMVTGELGGSIHGRQFTFTPRVREAQRLADLTDLHAMIDLSDGLAGDLGHVCRESKCGAVLDADAVPVSPEAAGLEAALSDGEDFELLFAVSPEQGRELLDTQPLGGVKIHRIGECVPAGISLRRDGKTEPLRVRGFEHDLG